jgi:hypothetical protein
MLDQPPFELVEVLSKYPKIRDAVMKHWHTKWLNEYLNMIITDTNGHTRAGFPASAFSAILQLQMFNYEYLIGEGMPDEDIESRFGFDTGFWDIPKNF